MAQRLVRAKRKIVLAGSRSGSPKDPSWPTAPRRSCTWCT